MLPLEIDVEAVCFISRNAVILTFSVKIDLAFYSTFRIGPPSGESPFPIIVDPKLLSYELSGRHIRDSKIN